MREAVLACGFEHLCTLRIDRGSYTFVHLLEHVETRTIAIVSWHGRARGVTFETSIGNRRQQTSCTDTTIDLPTADDVDRVELWGLVPQDVLAIHRALVTRRGELDPSSYRATTSAVRNDPLGWFNGREKQNVELLVKSGVSRLGADEMRFTWRGAARAVFSTSSPMRWLIAFGRARRTRALLVELGIAPTQRPVRPSSTRGLVYFIGVLLFVLVVWTCAVKP